MSEDEKRSVRVIVKRWREEEGEEDAWYFTRTADKNVAWETEVNLHTEDETEMQQGRVIGYVEVESRGYIYSGSNSYFSQIMSLVVENAEFYRVFEERLTDKEKEILEEVEKE